MHLVQLFLTLRDNRNQPFDHALFERVRRELVERFGGITAHQRSPAQGVWKEPDGDENRDEIVIFEVMAEELDRGWWKAYREELEERFRQEEMVVRAIPIETL
ncbi:MAG: hypothetical protein JO040_07055 [Gemmatimonadetes bacterium]|nr:hypothetical protein [Gemmatimonadota bacterium]